MNTCDEFDRAAVDQARVSRVSSVAAMSVVWLFAALVGCAPKPNGFTLTDHRKSGETESYFESFDEAFYDFDAQGNAEIVARRKAPGPGESGSQVTQLVHVRGVWNSIPGTTSANSTQINGTIRYAILDGDAGETFEGAGSLFFHHEFGTDHLIGQIERARLQPKRTTTTDHPLFERIELSGRFRAKPDQRRVTQLANEVDRAFAARQDQQTSRGRPAS